MGGSSRGAYGAIDEEAQLFIFEQPHFEHAARARGKRPPDSVHPIVSLVLSVNSKFPAQALLRSFIRYCRCREEQRMSAASEESPAKDPLDALYALSRRPTERAEQPRLAAVSEPPIARVPRPEMPRPMTSLSERLENAVAASVAVPMSVPMRRPFDPEVVPEPVDFRSEGRRRALIASVIGVGAAVAVASVVALLFVNIFPKDRDPDQSFAAAVQPAASQARPANDTAKAPLSQVRVPVVASDGGQNLNHEQSERLLQQFVQWRQKAASTDKQ
jgi:hypothetical protein